MTPLGRTALRAAIALAASTLPMTGVQAQYFGRNKVTYDDFDFRTLRTDHFDIYYYDVEDRQPILDFGRMAERWYERLARSFQHEFKERKPIIVYRNHPDFQQTNAISGFISQATGGVTESVKDRVVLPFAPSYGETEHVLGHELVHAFQYDIAQAGSRGGQTEFGRLPLWFVEGMAEYLSLGRESSHTAMWLRDAVDTDHVPGIRDLDDTQEYFPYRYGHALWAYIAGRWGDGAVGALYRAVAERGLERGTVVALQTSVDTLSAAWKRDSRRYFTAQREGRKSTATPGDVVLTGGRDEGTNLSPVLSPDGEHMVLLSRRDPFSIDLFLVNARTGAVEGRLANANSDPHFEALAFINTSGAWSPDGRDFAFVTYRAGANEIAVADIETRSVGRTFSVPGIGAVFGLAWSPDGRRITLSGSRGGVTDLFLLDVASGDLEALTDDRYAEWHPSWSPDGTRLVFATDRGPHTDFATLQFDRPGIGILDVATGDIDVRRFFAAKHLDPAFTPDGRGLYFVSDPDGFSDVYRADLADNDLFRVTRATTGVSGLTPMSPALSVASSSGRMVFTVFSDGGYAVLAREPQAARGEPVKRRTGHREGLATALLPPPRVEGLDLVSTYLGDATTGLPIDPEWQDEAYETDLDLDYVAQPTAGIAVDRFGTTLGGSVAAFFSDMLGNKELGIGLSVNGRIQDVGGEALYVDRGHRLNWGVRGARVPYRTAFTEIGTVDVDGRAARAIDLVINRTIDTRAAVLTEFPLSQTRRFEAQLGGTRVEFDREVVRDIVMDGRILDRVRLNPADPDPIDLARVSLAFVQDNSIFGFASPVDGGRMRLETEANVGSLDFVTALADVRRYVFLQPITLAFRGLHFGRYGRDGESARIPPLYLGQSAFVRGYSIDSFHGDECTDVPGKPSACPELDRLVGSRLAVANAELRIPLFGTESFGLIDTGFVPTELSLFADGGVAWTSEESPTLSLARRSTERVPVFSVGTSVRFNLLGRLILEVYYAHPFQRPDAAGQFGLQIAPGW